MTNVRDKLIIISVLLIAMGDMLLMAFRGFDGATVIRDCLLLLASIYKGNPAPSETSTTTETTASGTELKPLTFSTDPAGTTSATHPAPGDHPPRQGESKDAG
jgi:hypothetical protein